MEGRRPEHKAILPATVIYDVDFTMTLPESLSATSGVNAIAHAGIDNYTYLSQIEY